MIKSSENPEPPNKSWWDKHKDDILIWTSLGSFLVGLLQLVVLVR